MKNVSFALRSVSIPVVTCERTSSHSGRAVSKHWRLHVAILARASVNREKCGQSWPGRNSKAKQASCVRGVQIASMIILHHDSSFILCLPNWFFIPFPSHPWQNGSLWVRKYFPLSYSLPIQITKDRPCQITQERENSGMHFFSLHQLREQKGKGAFQTNASSWENRDTWEANFRCLSPQSRDIVHSHIRGRKCTYDLHWAGTFSSFFWYGLQTIYLHWKRWVRYLKRSDRSLP